MGNKVRKFKVGNKVRRIKDEFAGMKVGDIAVITAISSSGICFDECFRIESKQHDPDNFELVEAGGDLQQVINQIIKELS